MWESEAEMNSKKKTDELQNHQCFYSKIGQDYDQYFESQEKRLQFLVSRNNLFIGDNLFITLQKKLIFM